MTSHRLFLAALLLGAVLRAAVLPLPGTLDVTVWKIWAYAGATGSVAHMYGVGGTPIERRLLAYDGRKTTVDYPPLALYELAVIGRIYRAILPTFPNTRALTIALKLLIVFAEIGLVLLIFRVTRGSGDDKAMLAALSYWLNPAAFLDGPVLGYLDPLFALPALGAFACAASGRSAAAGVLFAAAVLTKAQALLLAPVIVLILATRHRRALATASVAAFATTAIIVAPFGFAGSLPNLVQGVASLARHDMLSGYAANLWWLVTYVMRAIYAVADLGFQTAFTMEVRILAISTVVDLGYPNPKPFAMVTVLVVVVWALWRARRLNDLSLMAGVGAFLVHAYFTLSVQVHENHLFLAVPLLAVAAAGRSAYRPLLFVLSSIAALNLNLFYGFGHGIGYALPRYLTVVDASVWLAVANIAAFIWHARVLSDQCRVVAQTFTPALPA